MCLNPFPNMFPWELLFHVLFNPITGSITGLLYFLILLQALNMSPCELFLYCLILLQALNCCPQEDAKRYNRNSFVLNRLLSRPSSVNLFFLSCFLPLTGVFFFFLAGWWSSIRWFAFFQCCHLLLSYFLSSVCLVSCAFFITTICFCVFCSLWWLGLLECHSCLKPTKLTQV